MKYGGTFADWLKQRRKALDLTQVELADQVGCSVVTIRKIEGDVSRPSKQMSDLLADVLAVADEDRAEFVAFARRRAVSSDEPLTMRTSAQSPLHNLPLDARPFIGRETELAQIAERLNDPRCRLLTIIGPGGIGKTRLALQAARGQIETFANGVYFVPLAGLGSPDFLVSSIGEAIGLTFYPSSDPASQLQDYLRDREVLLVLDNFEHLLEGANLVAAILHNAPEVKILATSRERLHLQEEWLFPIQGLSVPAQVAEDVQRYSAVQLFVATARRVELTFSASSEQKAVVNICQLVEGMPLAIELAAGWLRVMSGEEIARRIESDLNFLNTSLRDVPERHRSIRVVFAHSWELLSDDERAVLRKLSVFRGGFTLEAAQEVAEASLDLIASLVEKSLVRRREATRYDLHELVRQSADEKLREAGEADQTCQHHFECVLHLVKLEEPKEGFAAQLVWFRHLDQERDNIRTALDWSADHNVESGLEMAGSLHQYWINHSPLIESIGWLRKLLAQPAASAPDMARVKTLTTLSLLEGRQSLFDEGKLHAQEALALSQQLGNQAGVASAFHALATHYYREGKNLFEARRLVTESLAIYQSIGHKLGASDALSMLGVLVPAWDYAQGRTYLEQSLRLCREIGHEVGTFGRLYNLAKLAKFQGDIDSADVWLSEALELRDELALPYLGSPYDVAGDLALARGNFAQAHRYMEEDYWLSAQFGHALDSMWALSKLGYLALREGNPPEAYERFTDCIQHFRIAGVQIGVVYSVEGLASLAVRQNKHELAVRFLAWADATRKAEGDWRPPIEQTDVDRDIATIREHLDEASIAAAEAEGRALALDQVVDYALKQEFF